MVYIFVNMAARERNGTWKEYEDLNQELEECVRQGLKRTVNFSDLFGQRTITLQIPLLRRQVSDSIGSAYIPGPFIFFVHRVFQIIQLYFIVDVHFISK